MKASAVKDFIEIFALKPDVFGAQSSIDKDHFIDCIENVKVDLTKFEAAAPMMIAMMAITPKDDDDEKRAVLAALNQNRNLDAYIYENLPEEKEFYVIESKFWD